MGTIIMAPLATYLILGLGWRLAYFILGSGVGIIVLLAAQLYRRSPQEMGLLPDGKSPASTAAAQVAGAKGALASREGAYSLRQALTTGAFWHLALTAAVAAFSHQQMMQHLVANATDKGITPAVAATFMSVLGLSNIVGKLVMGMVSDRIGRRPSLLISLGLGATMMFWLVVARTSWMFYLFVAIFGWAYGSWIPMFPALVGDIFGLSSVGAIFGLVLTGNFIGGSLGGFLTGHIFDVTGSYSPAFLLAAVLLLVGVALILTLKGPRTLEA